MRMGGVSVLSFPSGLGSAENDYLKITAWDETTDPYYRFTFSLRTTGGDPLNANDDNKHLLFGFDDPWSSFSTVRINDTDYIYGYSSCTDLGSTQGTDFLTTTCLYEGDIRVTQNLTLVPNTQTGRKDVMEIRYIIQNTGNTSKSIGLRVMLDTMLGSNDGAPFQVPGTGAVTNEIEFLNTGIPDYWMAFDDLPSPTFLSQGTLRGGEATVPERIVFANWENIFDTSWDYTINPALPVTGDSAVGLYWNPETLAAGKKVEYVTYYGLGNVTQSINPDLSLSVTAPLSLTLTSNSYSPNPFTVIAYVENSQDVVLENVAATISLPTGLTLATGSQTQNIGILDINETKSVSWQVMAADQKVDTILTYVVSAIATHIAEKTVSRSIEIPALKSSGIGVFRPSTHIFYLDYNGNGRWDGGVTDRAINFGLNGDTPVSGDWNSLGKSCIGVFRPTTHTFYLDYNGNGRWDGGVTDRAINFGLSGDTPVSGGWNSLGKSCIGVFRPTTHTFYLDYNGNGRWDGGVTDRAINFGLNGDTPVSGDWNSLGKSCIGVFRPTTHTFYLDYNGNGRWDGGVTDRAINFGLNGDTPVSGVWG